MEKNITVIIKVPETARWRGPTARPVEIRFAPHRRVLAIRPDGGTVVFPSLQALADNCGLDVADIHSWREWKHPIVEGLERADDLFFARVARTARQSPVFVTLALGKSPEEFAVQAHLLLKQVMLDQLMKDKALIDRYRGDEEFRKNWREWLIRKIFEEINA